MDVAQLLLDVVPALMLLSPLIVAAILGLGNIVDLQSCLVLALLCAGFLTLTKPVLKRQSKARAEKVKRLAENRDFKVILVGCGLSGVCMGIKLKERGIPFKILEGSDNVGGTWYKNSYPGAGCDAESYVYSFSFAPNPNWSCVWALRDEILAYIERIVDQFSIRQHIQTSSYVVSASWDESASLWSVVYRDEDGTIHTETCNVFVSCVGQLNCPKTPDIKGKDSFAGSMFHTAEWDHSVPLRGSKVVVVGTGPSAMQVVPAIVDQVDHLSVVQRSPTYYIPKDNRRYFPFEKSVNRVFPFIQWLRRVYLLIQADLRFPGFYRDTTQVDGASFANRKFRESLVSFMHSPGQLGSCSDPMLTQKLTPSYPPGCKRLGLTSDYLRVFSRPNVALETAEATRVEKGALVVKHMDTGKEKKLDCDVLIWATGFKTATFMDTLKITAHGREIHEHWERKPRAYKGVMVHGFPNFFCMYGPNTNLGHHTIIYMIECEANYIVKLVENMVLGHLESLAVKKSAYDRYNAYAQSRLDQLVFASECTSWYHTAEGFNSVNWYGPIAEFWLSTMFPDFSAFTAKRAAK